MSAEIVDGASTVKPIGYKDKIGYMFGDFGNNVLIALCNFMFVKFYTDVMGLKPALVGTLMTVVAIITIFANIVIGGLVDRSKTTAHGKFKPWILRCSVPFALSSFLMYASYLAGAGTGVKITWMLVTYVLYMVVFYGMVEIPYGALASAITSDTKDRARLSNFRNLGGTLAMFVVSVIFPMLVFYKNSAGETVMSGPHMTWAALAAGVVAVICYVLVYSLTTERVTNVKASAAKIDFKAVAKAVVTSRSLMAVMLMVIFRELANTSIQGMQGYIYPNYFNAAWAMSVASTGSTVISFVAFLFMARLGIRFGKRETVAAGCGLIVVAKLITFLLQTQSAWVWIIFYWIITLGICCWGALAWGFIADLIDDQEVRTGLRTEGTVTAVFNMSNQIGQALSGLVIGFMLAGIGYTAETGFDPTVTHSLYNVECIIPAVAFLIVSLIIVFMYPLSKKKVEENAAILEQRHAELADA